MSRIAKAPIALPAGVDVSISGQNVSVKGTQGNLALSVHSAVSVSEEGKTLKVTPRNESDPEAWAMAGTMRALINNMVVGVSTGWQRKLELVGVGYRAQAKGKVVSLSLGFSHPVEYPVPDDITIETPSATEILVSGADRQRVGQAAAEIRAYRPPEPYKGKGVRYSDEQVVRKEAKKK
jgi:large subunit ribosomal protein L6